MKIWKLSVLLHNGVPEVLEHYYGYPSHELLKGALRKLYKDEDYSITTLYNSRFSAIYESKYHQGVILTCVNCTIVNVNNRT